MGSAVVSEDENAVENGIMNFSIRDMFAKSNELEQTGSSVSIELSYMEIYMEECFDLLAPLASSKTDGKENMHVINSTISNSTKERDNMVSQKQDRAKLDVRENNKGETIVEGLTSWPVATPNEVARLLSAAAKSRATSKTAMNAHSSRSHAIATFSMRIIKRGGTATTSSSATTATDDASTEDSMIVMGHSDEGATNITTTSTAAAWTTEAASNSSTTTATAITSVLTSKLHLVDLAGSERAKKTMATGKVFQEGVSINNGLLALGNSNKYTPYTPYCAV
jgi:hypothetical protein